MKRLVIVLLITLGLVPLFGLRKALVIGNASYEAGELRNSLNDSSDITAALTDLGFTVSLHENLNRAGFYQAVGNFVSALTPSDEVVFFYSGHAAQIDGTNYLIPVNEYIDSATRCAFLSYSCSMLLEELRTAAISIVILDACRDNPFTFSRSLSSGLASMKAAAGTQYVIFATEEGKTAEDGTGRNSPFTESLLANIKTPDKKVTDLVQIVSNEVAVKTEERQIPYSTGLLRQDFYFVSNSESRPITPAPARVAPTSAKDPVRTPVGKDFGSVKLVTKYGGDVYLDGEFHQSLFSNAETTWQDIPVGVHSVELKNPRETQTRKVNVIKNQMSLLDFDTPDTYVEELFETPEEPVTTSASPSTPSQPKRPAKEIVSTRAPLPPIKALLSGGTGNLEVLSPVSGDLYLGGKLMGNISADKLKKFPKVDAGDFTFEIMGKFNCYHQEVLISDKGTTKVNVSRTDFVTYLHDMIYVPSGEYMRGTQFVDRSENERPRHEVLLPPFVMNYTEVTQELWNSVMPANPSARVGNKLPVTNVSWYEALEFCNALSKRDGLEPCYKIDKNFPDANNTSDFDNLRYSATCSWGANGYRLPTEAEWEYVAKCGDNSGTMRFSGSNNAEEVAWFNKNSGDKTQTVATLKPNDWGFFDLSGNVMEWCWDYWGPYFKDKMMHPKGAYSGSYRIARGGSWQSDEDPCNNTARGGFSPNTQSNELGFRIVRSARAN